MADDTKFDLTRAIEESKRFVEEPSKLRIVVSWFFFFIFFSIMLVVVVELSSGVFAGLRDGSLFSQGPADFSKILDVSVKVLSIPVVSSVLSIGFADFFRPARREKPTDDFYTPIRKELVKLRRWTITFNAFFDGQVGLPGMMELSINPKLGKLTLGVDFQGSYSVKKEASDISLRVEQGTVFLLFYVENTATWSGKDSDDFRYMCKVNGTQKNGEQDLILSGQWFRLSMSTSGLADHGSCDIKALMN